MRIICFRVFFCCFLFWAAGFSGILGEEPGISELAPGSHDRITVPVKLNDSSPEQIEEAIKLLNRNWGLFPSVQFLRFSVSPDGPELLILRGRSDEVEAACRVAQQLDGLLLDAEEADTRLIPLPLYHLSAASMRNKILSLSARAGLAFSPEQLIVFPGLHGGSLFFQGTSSAGNEVREIKKELDQPRHESFLDLILGFFRNFRSDFSVYFLTISTCVASAILLLIIHFILIHIPLVGKFYQRWFTLIWTRLIDDIKGRAFAYEVIKSLVETAVETVEQSGRTMEKTGPPGHRAFTGSKKKIRALAIVRDLLIYRGFDPDNHQVKRIVNDLIESAVFRLNNFPGGNRIRVT